MITYHDWVIRVEALNTIAVDVCDNYAIYITTRVPHHCFRMLRKEGATIHDCSCKCGALRVGAFLHQKLYIHFLPV